MKNLINYFYHIYPDKIYVKNEVYYFYIEDYKYYFVLFSRPIDELTILVEITNTLYNQNIKSHTFIKNINSSFYVSYNGNNYVLLRVNHDENEEIDLFDIIKFNRSLISEDNLLHRNDWENRWTSQVDKFEEQIIEYNKEFPLLTNSFDYYIGLAENAISYIKTVEKEEDNKLYLSHKRIYMPMMYGMLYNPLNFMFDNKIRDVAEYIKVKFFDKSFEFEELENYLNENQRTLSLNDIKLLFSRLLYPTYYFDLFEQIINGSEPEEKIKKITEMSEDYEYFLFDTFNYFKTKYKLDPIDWIVNKY